MNQMEESPIGITTPVNEISTRLTIPIEVVEDTKHAFDLHMNAWHRSEDKRKKEWTPDFLNMLMIANSGKATRPEYRIPDARVMGGERYLKDAA